MNITIIWTIWKDTTCVYSQQWIWWHQLKWEYQQMKYESWKFVKAWVWTWFINIQNNKCNQEWSTTS